MLIGSETLWQTGEQSPASQAASPATRSSDTTSAAADAATAFNGCSVGSKTGDASQPGMTDVPVSSCRPDPNVFTSSGS